MTATKAKTERYGKRFPAEWDDTKIELWSLLNLPEKGKGMHGHLKGCMTMLWPDLYSGELRPGVPKWRPDLELLTWAYSNYKIVSVIGHASAAKTHTFGHIACAQYLADPQNTITTLTSTHLKGLRSRLWSDVRSAATTAHNYDSFMSIRKHDMTMRPIETPGEDKYVIEGIAVDQGTEAVEKIQGNHSRNRRHVVIDEAQGTPGAIFEACANLMTDPDFRLAMLANPTTRYSEFGSWCEPIGGWNSIDPDEAIWWETARGGICIRLDGLRSANLLFQAKHPNDKVPFPFLIDQGYVDQIIKSYGLNSPRYWVFVRGWFPPDGTMGTIFPTNVIEMARDPIIFDFPPTPCAALDPAFEGGDECVLMFGDWGDSRNKENCFNLKEAHVVKKDVADGEERLPLDYRIAYRVKKMCEDRGVKPENFIMDSTGAGRGVAAILQREWGAIEKCNFGGAPTDRKLRADDDQTCDELFDRFVSELWYSARAFMEENMIGGINMEFKELREQLAARNYETVKDKKDVIETKKKMKIRVGYSPDHADAFCLFTELLKRKGAVAGKGVVRRGNPDVKLKKRARMYSEIEAGQPGGYHNGIN